jgi:hypothetical protein
MLRPGGVLELMLDGRKFAANSSILSRILPKIRKIRLKNQVKTNKING